MPPSKRSTPPTDSPGCGARRQSTNDQPFSAQCREVMATLRPLGEPRVKRDMHERYGITGRTAERSFGVSVGKLQKLAKSIGVNHELSLALWNHDGGWYDARMLAALIGDPARVTATHMDAWCRDFDNWGICDTVCFKLFDRVEPTLAFRKIDKWSSQRDEFVKRGGFALLACVALHRKDIPDGEFIARLPLIERGSTDDRNFVKKGVLWALRGVGSRTPARRKAALALATSLAESTNAAARWVGRNAARELGRAKG